jgi:hypothetical protein
MQFSWYVLTPCGGRDSILQMENYKRGIRERYDLDGASGGVFPGDWVVIWCVLNSGFHLVIVSPFALYAHTRTM